MYARFTEAAIDPKQREQVTTIAKSIFTAAKQQKGFKGLSFCLDSKGEGLFVSLWESKDALQANESNGFYQEQVAKLKDVLTRPTVRHAVELKADHETHKTPKAARLTITPIRKDGQAQVTKLAQEVATAASKEAGFVGFYGGLSEEGKSVAISFWESEDAMRKSESGYLKDVLMKLKELAETQPQPRMYEVVAHEIPATVAVR